MASEADPISLVADGIRSQNTRSALRVVVLFLIAAAAVASRLFSVIRAFVPCNGRVPVPDLVPSR